MRLFTVFCAVGWIAGAVGCASSSSQSEEACTNGQVSCNNVCIPEGTPCSKNGTGGSSVNTGGTLGYGGAAAGQGGAASLGGSNGTSPAVTAPVSCTDVATATGSFQSQYTGTQIPVTGKDKSYYLTTNWWHVYNQQSIQYNGLSFQVIDNNNVSVPKSDGSPTGFPAFYIGSYQGRGTSGSNLPKLVSSIKTIPTVFSTNSRSLGPPDANAAYDVWFSQSASGVPGNYGNPGAGGAYLMVWLYKTAGRSPRGGVGGIPNEIGRTVNGVDGTWDLWLDRSTVQPPCVSYVSSTRREELTVDLGAFIRDAVANDFIIKETMYLSIIFAGFEVWGGGNGLKMKNFCVEVN